ncbi:hypothetical protein P280DRAFT_390249 [Massarina eburnea CBS 473.64]|uniref:Uncharacterized protein n=1 Tax=Massarina eburnea CBS 473.64 TaxID=1395130 RepID=A0A6A6SC90_9PLEO|nr:hypothetical protein P280DRAFT_390249 [Massarina eburnea CBS 473.64]
MVQPNAAGNPLSAESLSTIMAASLPKGAEHQLKNAYEAVALATHAGMLAVGFRLIGSSEDDKIEATADAHNLQQLPTAWNTYSSYSFRYAHSQSSMEYLIKVNRLGGKAVVLGLAVGADKTTTLDVTVKDFISESSLPISAAEDASSDDISRKIQDVFITAGRLSDFGALLKLSMIQKLAPGLGKEGYEETNTQDREENIPREAPERDDSSRPRQPPPRDPEPARPYPFTDPLAQPRQPGRPFPEPMPGFEDEYEVIRPPGGGLRDDRFPGGIGHNDLYPPGLGPHDPLRPHFGGGLPRPGGMGGGMHPTFDDPMFGGQGGPGGYDPMAPPGARFDPLGPGAGPRGGPRFPGGGPGGRPPNPFGGFGGGDFI